MNKLVVMLEDDSDDRYLTGEILAELGIDVPVRFFSKSNELLDFLSGPEKPSLILLDYNAAPDNGITVLQKLKSDPATKEIPVVILSDNDLQPYRSESYRNGASSFIKKPASMEQTRQKIGTFFRYWFDVAEV
jgi:CheY-like chemotaxis protein